MRSKTRSSAYSAGMALLRPLLPVTPTVCALAPAIPSDGEAGQSAPSTTSEIDVGAIQNLSASFLLARRTRTVVATTSTTATSKPTAIATMAPIANPRCSLPSLTSNTTLASKTRKLSAVGSYHVYGNTFARSESYQSECSSRIKVRRYSVRPSPVPEALAGSLILLHPIVYSRY